MKRSILFLLIVNAFLLILIGCSREDALEEASIDIIISKDFGSEELDNKTIRISEGSSVMEVMEKNFDIETAYGGGFINAINGFRSGFTGAKDRKKVDWFYYVNGVLAEVGASEYYLKSDDVIIWDYHDWSNSIYLSSVIGAYPRNFTNGHEGNSMKTEILHGKDYDGEGKQLEKFLKENGLENIELESLNGEELEKGEINSIVIGPWDEISKLSYIKDVYENGKKAGLFFKLDQRVKALNYKGEVSREYEKAAIITSIAKEYGLWGRMWLVTGNDKTSIKKALKLLYEEPEKIKGKFSVIVTEDEIVNIPVKN